MNIYLTILRETERHRDRIAVIEGERSVTYGRLFVSVDQVAASLKAEGVGPCDRVGILCADGIDYITVSLAVLSLSAVVVPISPEQSASEIDDILGRISVHYLVAEKGAHERPEARTLPAAGFCTRTFSLSKRTVPQEPPEQYYSVNPAFIRFTSGTTGASKGIVLSHESIIERTDAANKGLQITAQDTVLWMLSMSFHFVVTILLFLRRGATIVLCGHRYPSSLIEGVRSHKGTFIYSSPFYYSLLSRTEALPGDALKQIRFAVSTTMKLPENIAEEFYAKFGFELTEAYGIIEVGLPFIRLAGGKDKRGSVGKPLPDFEIGLDNKDAEGVGEIRIRGKGMLDAYYSPWQGREHILVDGWFKTGDLGKIDKDGFLFIVGRDKDVINFAGMKVFAHEVESVLNQHPQIRESLVYGAPHPQYGHLPISKIVLQEGNAGLDANDLRRFCYQRMARYKVPKDFEFVDSLPKTASGKIRR